MKKEQMMNIVEDLMKITEKSLNSLDEAIKKCIDSPRAVSEFNCIRDERVRTILSLKSLKNDIENHGNENMKMNAMFGMPVIDDGLVIDEEGDK